MSLLVVLISFSLVLTLLFFIYGFNHYYLINAASHYTQPLLPDLPQDAPRVAIHLPVYNEKYVIRRWVAAFTRMAEAYGMHRVKIYIFDDSEHGTAGLLDEVVEGYRRQRFCIEVLRRATRQGFKSGALQMALEQTDKDFVAIFDADFTPRPTFSCVRCLTFSKTNGWVSSRAAGRKSPAITIPSPGRLPSASTCIFSWSRPGATRRKFVDKVVRATGPDPGPCGRVAHNAKRFSIKQGG